MWCTHALSGEASCTFRMYNVILWEILSLSGVAQCVEEEVASILTSKGGRIRKKFRLQIIIEVIGSLKTAAIFVIIFCATIADPQSVVSFEPILSLLTLRTLRVFYTAIYKPKV
jgi:hypothetical protein